MSPEGNTLTPGGYRPAGTLDGWACFYRQRNRAGKVIGQVRLDGATIAPLLDREGNAPEDGPAYVQMVNGLPWNWLTRDDLVLQRAPGPAGSG